MSNRTEIIMESLLSLNSVVDNLRRLIVPDGVGRLPGGVAPASGTAVYTEENMKEDFLEFTTAIFEKCKLLTGKQVQDVQFIFNTIYESVPQLQQNFNNQFKKAEEHKMKSAQIDAILKSVIKTQIGTDESQYPGVNIFALYEFVTLIVQECIARSNETVSGDIESFVAKIKEIRKDNSADFGTLNRIEGFGNLCTKISNHCRTRAQCDIGNIQRIRSNVGRGYKSLKEEITNTGISAARFEACLVSRFLYLDDEEDKFIFTLMHGPMALEAYSEQHPQ
jgi:hypothetical protein